MSFLGDLLGDALQKQDYQGFTNRFKQGSPAEGYSDHEVLQRCQQIAPQLSLGTFIRIYSNVHGH